MKDYGYQQQRAEVYCPQPRAPMQIEYDVEIYGSEKIELPFVMAVLADLAGKPREELPPVTDRKFLDIDIDNFNERMKAIARAWRLLSPIR